MTLVNFVAYVKRDFKRTDKDTEIIQAYNDAILDVASRIPHNGFKYQSWLPLIEKQEDYPYPTPIMYILHPLRLLEGNAAHNTGGPLNKIPKDEYDIKYPNPNRTDSVDTGIPVDYCCYGGGFLLGPAPDSVAGNGYLIETSWAKIPVDQASDSDVTPLEETWREVLKQMTLSKLYAGLQQYEASQFYRALYEDGLGDPVGLLKRLLNIENGKETMAVTKMHINVL